jgi:hypothetical protein
MARIELSPPPSLPPGASYQQYRSWLLENFFQYLCSYCLIQHESLDIDHYEPQEYRPARINDPTNLLLACRRCNGPAGKWDYHPQYAARRRLPHDHSGFLVLDVRRDNLGAAFALEASGELTIRPGPHAEWAVWNILLLKLDLDFLVSHRKRLYEKLMLCERLLLQLTHTGDQQAQIESVLAVLIPDLAEHVLLFHALDIPVSMALSTRLQQVMSSHGGFRAP